VKRSFILCHDIEDTISNIANRPGFGFAVIVPHINLRGVAGFGFVRKERSNF
jgi:hypothetical protein